MTDKLTDKPVSELRLGELIYNCLLIARDHPSVLSGSERTYTKSEQPYAHFYQNLLAELTSREENYRKWFIGLNNASIRLAQETTYPNQERTSLYVNKSLGGRGYLSLNMPLPNIHPSI